MSLPQEMQVVSVPAFEGPSAARTESRPVPSPRPGQLLLRVHAAGINYADVMQTRGLYVGGPKPPYVAGVEAAGEVVAVGDGVDVPLGTRMLGAGPAAFAEFVAWPAAALAPIPESWSFEQGAAFFVQWYSAHGCLRTVGRLRAGEWVLVHAAAGGVGSAAIRLAKHFGAHVIATASSSEKLERAQAMGADVLVNYSEDDFVEATRRATKGQGADLILEMVGGETFKRNLDAVRSFGRIVVFGSASAQSAQVDNVSLIFRPMELLGYHLQILMDRRPDLFREEVAEIQQLIADGVILPEAPSVYTYDEASAALSALEERKTTGKLVLRPASLS